jgi:large subunit ribosomal protein L9
MEVILRETIDNLGRRGEVVDVKNGYARNYLLPQKLALLVTDANRRQVDREREASEEREAEERKVAERYAARLQAVECVIARRVGETDTLYGSVTAADIAECFEGQQLEVDKRKIQLGEPIKELGEFPVAVRLHRDVTTEITVKVVKEVIETAAADGSETPPASA